MFKNLYANREILTTFLFITIVYHIKAATNRDNFCYAPEFLDTSWSDRRPDFVVNMTFSKRGTIASLTWVNRDILVPIVKLKILQKEFNEKITILYNVTARLCDLQQYTSKISMFHQALQTTFKQGNYSMSCPMKKGFYVMDNVRVGLRNPLLSFLHRPKLCYTIEGGLYEEMPNKSVIALTTYNITFKVARKSCKGS
ncbi:uncharacterized protein LOC124421446 [Lucilia cuprina]|uniref:uncharacterized protein LOC124421446 n=1 Tax=Lucilia cuprina TaxID=7375 RepID=UPI001F06CA60|nr:uncharacterized protein LOC124421446 [Lucilia cuprina]